MEPILGLTLMLFSLTHTGLRCKNLLTLASKFSLLANGATTVHLNRLYQDVPWKYIKIQLLCKNIKYEEKRTKVSY